jgi:hypothetical protein
MQASISSGCRNAVIGDGGETHSLRYPDPTKGQKWSMTSLWQGADTTPNNRLYSEWNILQTTTPEPLPKPELRWWSTQSHLWLGLFTVHAFVPYPQFFCLPRPVANVCTQDPLVFFLMLVTISRVYLTTYLTLSPKAYIPLYRLPLKTMPPLQEKCCFYVN